jgi:putative hemolysin
MEAFDWAIPFKLVSVVLLVAANGFFVASEFALVALRRSRIDQLCNEGYWLGPSLRRANQNLDAYLAATQLGITLSSLGLGWIGEPAVAVLIEPAFEALPPPFDTIGAHTVAVIIAFCLITFLHIVFGELIPKSLALQRAERVSIAIVQPLAFFLLVLKPAIFLLNGFGNWLLRKWGLRAASGEGHVHSPEELRLLVHSASEAGLIEDIQESLVDRVFTLGERRIAACMTPRQDIEWIDARMSVADIRDQIRDSSHTRFPVRLGEDEIVGVLSAKTILPLDPFVEKLSADAVEPAVFVHENARALAILERFQRDRAEFAVVVDEYGDVMGVVTLMDILRAVIGKGDLPKAPPLAAETPAEVSLELVVDGGIAMDDFRRALDRPNLGLDDEFSYHTAAGFVLYRLERMPEVGVRIIDDDLEFEVREMSGHRITRIAVRPTGRGDAAGRCGGGRQAMSEEDEIEAAPTGDVPLGSSGAHPSMAD